MGKRELVVELKGLEMYRGSGISFVRDEDNVQIVEPFKCYVSQCYVDSSLSLCQKQTEVYIDPMEVFVSHADISLMTALAINWTKFDGIFGPKLNTEDDTGSHLYTVPGSHSSVEMHSPKTEKVQDNYVVEFTEQNWGILLEQEQVCFVIYGVSLSLPLPFFQLKLCSGS
jgi:hypothetical protein